MRRRRFCSTTAAAAAASEREREREREEGTRKQTEKGTPMAAERSYSVVSKAGHTSSAGVSQCRAGLAGRAGQADQAGQEGRNLSRHQKNPLSTLLFFSGHNSRPPFMIKSHFFVKKYLSLWPGGYLARGLRKSCNTQNVDQRTWVRIHGLKDCLCRKHDFPILVFSIHRSLMELLGMFFYVTGNYRSHQFTNCTRIHFQCMPMSNKKTSKQKHV